VAAAAIKKAAARFDQHTARALAAKDAGPGKRSAVCRGKCNRARFVRHAV